MGATAAAMAVTSGGLFVLALMVTVLDQPPDAGQLLMLIFLACSPLLPFLAQLAPAGRLELVGPTEWMPVTRREADAALLVARTATATLGAGIAFGSVGILAVFGGLFAFFLSAPVAMSAVNTALAVGFAFVTAISLALSYAGLAFIGSWLLLPVWLAEGRDAPGARLPGPLLLGWVAATAALAATPGGLWLLAFAPLLGMWGVERLGVRAWRLPWSAGNGHVQTRPWWIGAPAVAVRGVRGAITAVAVGVALHLFLQHIQEQAGGANLGVDANSMAVVVVAVLVPVSVMLASTLPTPPKLRPWPVPGLPPPDLRYLEHLPIGRGMLLRTRTLELLAGVGLGLIAVEVMLWLLGLPDPPIGRDALTVLLFGLEVPSLVAWSIAARWPSWRAPLPFASLAVLALIAIGLSLTPFSLTVWLLTGNQGAALALAALGLATWAALALHNAWRVLPG